MSQDQPPPPEPQEPKPEVPVANRGQRLSAAKTKAQPLTTSSFQKNWRRLQPVLKTQVLKVLRGTVQVLEAAIAKVETLDSPPPPTVEAPASRAETGSELPWSRKLLAQFQALLARLQPWWAWALEQIRARLPESLNQKLSDQGLTGAIAGLLIILLWIGSGLFPNQSPPQEVRKPPSQRRPPPELTAPPALKAPETPQPVVVSPPPPAPLPSPAPAPVLKLDPEQKLIADIQTQVTEITDQYAQGLIQAVQANFQDSRLTVNVSDGWYSLSAAQQDKLATEILQRSQALDFSKLNITKAETVLARSPVVGTEIVILKRHKPSEAAS